MRGAIVSNPSHKSVNTLVGAAGDVLTPNVNRRDGLIHNLGTEKLYVKKGTGCSTSDFTVILAPGSTQDDGFGGSFPIGPYSGVVSIAGTTPRCMVSEDIG